MSVRGAFSSPMLWLAEDLLKRQVLVAGVRSPPLGVSVSLSAVLGLPSSLHSKIQDTTVARRSLLADY